MAEPLYYPFRTLNFTEKNCFISGKPLHSSQENISVFPDWLMERYHLKDKPFKLLDESFVTYPDLKLPCAQAIKDEAIIPLETEIQHAFLEGYTTTKRIPDLTLFQWVAKLVYGILFHEIRIGIRQQKALGEPFNISHALVHKLTNLHIMLQSMIRPLIFERNLPWTIKIFNVKNDANTFSYRDEINTLTFSLRMQDFGLIACLQDNGTNAVYHQQLIEKFQDRQLEPIQFEEICGRFFYSNYLFNRLPEYTFALTDEAIYVDNMPLRGISNKPLFDTWENKVYAQVLENFWKEWGYSLFEIIKNPDEPMSFLQEQD